MTPLTATSFFDSQCMFVCDQVTLEILDVNDVTVTFTGLNKAELLTKKLTDIVQEPTAEEAKLIKKRATASSFDEVWVLTSKKGTHRWIQFSSHVITYKNHAAKLLIAHDLTNHLTPIDQTQVVSAPVGFQGFPLAEIEWKRNGEIIRWSDKAEELFGYTQEELIEDFTLLDNFVFHEDKEFVFHTLEQGYAKKNKNISIVNRNVTKQGEVVYCEWYNSILFDAQGVVVSIYSLVANVTDRVEAHQESEKSRRSYRDLFDSISDAIYLLDEEECIVIANKGMKETYGYHPREVMGKNQMILRAAGKFDADLFKKIHENEHELKVKKLDAFGQKANGEVFQSEMTINKGSYFGKDVLIIIERDVSDRKFAEAELLRREKLFGELFNTSPLGITLLNDHDEIELINSGFEQMFGYEREEIKGLEVDRLIVPKEYLSEAEELTATKKVAEKESVRITKSGELIDVIVYSVPVIIDRKIKAKFGIYVDITDRKKAEKYIKTSLREKEVLLAEIHHRVKNNLAVITGLLELQAYTTENINAQRVLKDSQMRVHSIALVHEMLYQNENLTDIYVQPYIFELVESVQKALKTKEKKIQMHYDLDDINLEITQAIPCGLLINEIVTNSYKHAFKGRKEGNVRISFKKTDHQLLLAVQDDGVGLNGTEDFSTSATSLGMKLIRTLSKQLKAESEISVENGIKYTFEFERKQTH